MIVTAGREKLCDLIVTNFTYVAIGDGGDATSSSQEHLDNEVRRNSATVNRKGDKVEYVVEFSGANLASASISELGIFNTATSGASGEAMLSRVNFNALTPLASTDKLEFKFTMVVA